MLLDISTFVGHLHPLVVHLPIGFLLLAMLLELASYVKKYRQLKSAVGFTLLLGFVAASIACVCGYMLSLAGDYDYQRLSYHKTAGIAVAIVSGLLFLMTTRQFVNKFSIHRKVFSILMVGLFVLTSYSGHQGGSLTHGSDYLSLNVLTKQNHAKPSTVEEALLFEQVVQPLLARRCSQCHREGKLKGKLSVQSLNNLLKGGKTGPAVVGGKLDESELYKRISYDPTHEKFMPADGKPPLTKAETAIMRWWIEKGMAQQGKKISELKNSEEIKSQVSIFLGLSEKADNSGMFVYAGKDINPAISTDFNMALADTLRNRGVNVRVMLHQPIMLDVTVPAGSGVKVESMQKYLKAIAKNVIWLNLSGNGLTEDDLDFLPHMINLEKLRLDNNPIGDDIVKQLIGLHHLEVINLSETKLSRSGLEKLKAIPNLKRVYSWRTQSSIM
jgi:uncharacterized membrane protein